MKKLCFITYILLAFTALSAQGIDYFHAVGWYPFTMRNNDTGELYGLSVDFMNEIAKEMNITATIKDVPWKRGFVEMDAGVLDICAGAYDNEERRKKYIFSDSLMKNQTRIYVNKNDNLSIKKLQDLIGKKLGKPLGASYGTDFDNFVAENMSFFETEGKKLLVKMLLTQRVDCIVSDFFDMGNYLRTNNLEDIIVPADYVIGEQDVYLLLSKLSAIKISEINDAISNIKNSGRMKEILGKY